MKKKYRNAFTLLECLVVMLVLIISMGGLIGFRYYSVLSAEQAETHLLAAHTAQVLAESWKGQKGNAGFDPLQHGFGSEFQVFTNALTGPKPTFSGMSGIVLLGNYMVQTEGRTFQTILAYQDMAAIGNARTLLIRLNWTDRNGRAQNYEVSTVTQTVL